VLSQLFLGVKICLPVRWIEEGLDKLLKSESVSVEQRNNISAALQKRYQAEISKLPKIAIIGPTGVGKSSTINALFGSDLPVSDTKAGTRLPSKIEISTKSFKPKKVQGEKGDFILYDMPGIGEDIEKDKEYEDIYRQIISQCDVAVWVMSAVDRRMAEDQRIIRDVVIPANASLAERLVIGVNKVDAISPDDWDREANLPSTTQEANLDEIVGNIRNTLLNNGSDKIKQQLRRKSVGSDSWDGI
jgi:uncharacterized protein